MTNLYYLLMWNSARYATLSQPQSINVFIFWKFYIHRCTDRHVWRYWTPCHRRLNNRIFKRWTLHTPVKRTSGAPESLPTPAWEDQSHRSPPNWWSSRANFQHRSHSPLETKWSHVFSMAELTIGTKKLLKNS